MNSLLHKNNFASESFMPNGKAKQLVQPKLTINTPGDKYEREADAMADSIMRMPANENAIKHTTGLIGAGVQRKFPVMRKTEAGSGGMQASSSLASSLNASKGGGSPLPQGTKIFMENAFSTDFSEVRIHADNQASEMSEGINAKAFTYGNDIYFNQGQYDPNSGSGKNLLAHELTHVVQQRAAGTNLSMPQNSSAHLQTNGLLQRQDEPPAATACPSPVTGDTVLTSDCSGRINIGANKITLDCAGHIITGSGTGNGITLSNRRGVTIKNCTVQNFSVGIRPSGSNNNHFIGNTSQNNIRDGFDLDDSSRNTFENNIASNNGRNGIELDNCNGNSFNGNTASNNGNNGYSLDHSDRNHFTSNTANNNTNNGFSVHQDSDSNRFNSNTARRNGDNYDSDNSSNRNRCRNNNFTPRRCPP